MSFKKILFLAFVFFQLTPLAALAADPTYPIIDSAACAKDAASGGWGGTCQFILVDLSSLGLGESNGCTSGREWAGYCGETGGDWSDLDYSCCIPAGSTAQGPFVGEAFYRDSACTLPKTSGGAYGGTCKASCASGEKYAGACGESDTPCCVSSDTPVPSETNTISNSGTSLAGPGAVNVGTNYTPLEYIPFLNGTTFQDYILGVYILGMVLVVLAAVFMLVIGGFQYLTSAGNTSALSSAKHTIEGALFGLALALVAYLILYVINPDLTKLNISTFQPLAQQAVSPGGGGGGAGGGGGGGGTGYFAAKKFTGSNVYDDATARKKLTDAGISVTSSGNCSTQTNASCTSLQQMPATVINFLIQLKRDCGCTVTVTGGTEVGHATHGPGNAAVDIGRGGILNFMQKQPILSTQSGRPVYGYNGFRVWDEDSGHFHAWLPAN